MIVRARGVGQAASSTINWLGQATEVRSVTLQDGSVVEMEFDKTTGEPISTWQVLPPGSMAGGASTWLSKVAAALPKNWPIYAAGLIVIMLLAQPGGGRRRR